MDIMYFYDVDYKARKEEVERFFKNEYYRKQFKNQNKKNRKYN